MLSSNYLIFLTCHQSLWNIIWLSAPVWTNGGILLGQLLEHLVQQNHKSVSGTSFVDWDFTCVSRQPSTGRTRSKQQLEVKSAAPPAVVHWYKKRRCTDIVTHATSFDEKTMVSKHSYHAVWGGVYPFVFLGQWQRQWHSAIDDGRDNDKHNGKDDGRGQWRLWTGTCLKILWLVSDL